MVSAVRSRPNHYETLGLSPSASDDEIRSAFARMMGMFGAHPVVAATGVSAAFEVLRNPDKRRAYDRELGLAPEPISGHWRVSQVGWRNAGVMGAAWGQPATQESRRSEAPTPNNPPTDAAPAQPSEPRLASFISDSLRDLARPVAPELASDVEPQNEPRPLELGNAGADVADDGTAASGIEAENWLDAESRPLDLRRPALFGLGAVVAAGLIGAIAGASADDRDQQPPPPTRGVTVALPAAAAEPGSATPTPAAAARVNDLEAQRPPRAETRPVMREDKRPPRAQIAAAAQLVENKAVAESGPAATPPTVGDDSQPALETGAKLVAASLPLPDRVVARTIARIGYSCGSVVSTTNVEGAAPGVYKVACSSGETFHATPVRGRYRFRRAGQ